MAKKTKFKEEINKNNSIDATSTISSESKLSEGTLEQSDEVTNVSASVIQHDVIAMPNDDYEQFEIVKQNIVPSGTYIMLNDLTEKYHLFNNIDITRLTKSDLIVLIGLFIDKFQKKEQEFNNFKNKSNENSVIMPSYADLLDCLNTPKSWN